MKTTYLVLSVPKSLIFYTLSRGGSLHQFPSTAGLCSLMRAKWVQHNVIRCHFIALSFSRTIVHGFPWPIFFQVLGYPSSFRQPWVPPQGVGLQFNQIMVGYSGNFCSAIAPAYLSESLLIQFTKFVIYNIWSSHFLDCSEYFPVL